MPKMVTYEVFENGYDLYIQDGERPRQLVLHQPEPHIVCRVLNEDGTTNYEESAKVHTDELANQLAEPVEEMSEIEKRIEKIENNQIEAEVDIDYRLSLLELELV